MPRAAQDPETVKLSNYVKLLSCIYLVPLLCCGGVACVTLVTISAVLPKFSPAGLEEMCRTGEMDAKSCEQLLMLKQQFCQQQQKGSCDENVDALLQAGKPALLGVALILVLILGCASLVPLCGYCGAKKGSRAMLVCFIIFNGLSTISFLDQLEKSGFSQGCSAVSLAFQLVLPLLSVYCACRLQQRLSDVQAMTEPLLQAQFGAQVAYPQPPAENPAYVPAQTQQAFHMPEVSAPPPESFGNNV